MSKEFLAEAGEEPMPDFRASSPDILRAESVVPRLIFDIKRRTHPEAAFADVIESLNLAMHKDKEIKRAFSYVQKRFHGTPVRYADAARLAALEKKDINVSEFAVGSLPAAIGPGLAFIYDATLEVLRSSDRRLLEELSDARAIRAIGLSMDQLLPLIGTASVTAMEMALGDTAFREHLKERSDEITDAYIYPTEPGPCEFCTMNEVNAKGEIVDTWCGGEDECSSFGIVWVVVAIVWLGKEFLEWVF